MGVEDRDQRYLTTHTSHKHKELVIGSISNYVMMQIGFTEQNRIDSKNE